MSGLDDRGQAYENKFAHDEELKFKATARRNKLLGLWAAEKLGKSGDDADEYAKAVIRSDFEEPGEEDVYRKVKADLDEGVSGVTEDEIRGQMSALMATAVEQIENE